MSARRIIHGDALERLRELDAGSAQACVTSPPYWGLRDYGADGQIGLEETPEAYIARLVAVFEEVRRVLADDGCLWLNLGDSYNGSSGSGGATAKQITNAGFFHAAGIRTAAGLKPKDLVGIPWRVAFALQSAGWYLRSDVIWAKPNPMPESVTDRPTKAHEYIFLLTKAARYFYDADAVREAHASGEWWDRPQFNIKGNANRGDKGQPPHSANPAGRNARTVWTITPKPYNDAHFATFPPELPRRCILASTRRGDVVLDPFAGSGTTGAVALAEGREALMIELNPDYCKLMKQRLARVTTGVTEREQKQGQRGMFEGLA
mgnify:CR=1 FL=1